MKKNQKNKIEYVRYNPPIDYGLTTSQLNERKKNKLINKDKSKSSKSYFGIFIKNTFTYFNLIWAIIIFAYIYVGSYNNLLFTVVIFLNTAIAIIQECKAKHTVDKLSLVTAPKVNVIRNGQTFKINSSALYLDDIITLDVGNQIPADCILIDGFVEMNESLLTGESNSIKKKVGDTLLAGSFVVSGTCYAKVDKIGSESYIQSIAKEAKKFKSPNSNLFRDLNTIIKYIGIAIIPIAIIMFINNMATSYNNFTIAITKTCGALTGMVPAGMFLLVTIALSIGVVKLSKKETMVKDLYSIEMLARTNMLCLDKTGTITDGTMIVTGYKIFGDNVVYENYNLDNSLKNNKIDIGNENISTEQLNLKNKFIEIISAYLSSHKSNNQTSQSMIEYFGNQSNIKADKILPFSSERKHSACFFSQFGSFFLGAPEFVCSNIPEEIFDEIKQLNDKSQRVLMLSHTTEEFDENDPSIYNKVKPFAIISIEDHIRDDAIETINWFKENGVKIKIISGDNPNTVSAIAKRVGIEGSEQCVSLEGISSQDVYKMADRFTIFGRVSPEQKHQLVKALKAKGYVVAMTGDGVNDTLALKESDCSIAMADGSDVARNISNLVLMNSKFSSLPDVVCEGRQVVNNIQKSSTLFLMKTFFSFFFAFFVIILHTTYPFESVQLLLIEMFVIGIPSFILALEPNNDQIKGEFINTVLKKAIPSAILLFINVGIIIVLHKFNLITQLELETLTVLMLTLTGLLNLVRLAYPFTKVRALTVLVSALCVTLAILIVPEFFGMFVFNGTVSLVSLIILTCSIPYLLVMPKLENLINKIFKTGSLKNKHSKISKN